jgi:holo-[acyl-carrier protein] synthase
VIVGIGVDIVDISRVSGLLDRYKDRFLDRVFTDAEILYAKKSVKTAERLAGRFAVKESVLKAFGTGKSQGILWKDIETVRGPMGKPKVNLYGQAVNYMKKLNGSEVLVTITHDDGKAIAFVVIERSGGKE